MTTDRTPRDLPGDSHHLYMDNYILKTPGQLYSFIPSNKGRKDLSCKLFRRFSGKSVIHSLAWRSPDCLARASLTIEAAFVLPLMIFIIAAVISFISLISFQADLQRKIDEYARELARLAYVDEGDGALTRLVTNPLVLQARLDDTSSLSRISGFNTLLSSYDKDSGILDIEAAYRYSIPFFPEGFPDICITQRMRCRVWIGKELSASSDPSGTDKNTVYITPDGDAYHMTPYCNYLDLSMQAVPESLTGSLRNLSGHKYKQCSRCASSGSSDMVYITDYGTLWHADILCSALKRTVIAVDITEVGERHLCPKCGTQQ